MVSAQLNVVETKPLLKLDLAGGQNAREGFQCVDVWDGAGIVHDLTVTPWPFEDESCEELHCSHFMEHLTGFQHIDFMNEAWRVLIPGGKLTIIVPHWKSARAWQDPTHIRPVPEAWMYYWSQAWLKANKLTHGPYAAIKCNFEIVAASGYSDPRWLTASEGARAFADKHYTNTIDDTHFHCTKRAMD